jgi:hypothetical protein
MLTTVNNIAYNGIYQRINIVNKEILSELLLRLRASVMSELTVQIYNTKKALSRVLIKNFYHNFWKKVKLFNLQDVTLTLKIRVPNARHCTTQQTIIARKWRKEPLQHTKYEK